MKSSAAIPGSLREIMGLLLLSGMFLKEKKSDSHGRVTQKGKRKRAGCGP